MPGEEQAIKKLSDLTGDEDLIDKIKKLAATEEDPPVLFAWNTQSLQEFWARAVAYQGTAGAIAIPINGGVNLPVEADVDLLKKELLEYLCGLHPGPPAQRPIHLGSAIGLGCTLVQSLNSVNFLTSLEIDPLTASLATVHTPRPRHEKGLLDDIIIGGELWG